MPLKTCQGWALAEQSRWLNIPSHILFFFLLFPNTAPLGLNVGSRSPLFLNGHFLLVQHQYLMYTESRMDRRKNLLEGKVCKDCVNTGRQAINSTTLQLQHVGFRKLFMVYAHMHHWGQKIRISEKENENGCYLWIYLHYFFLELQRTSIKRD